MSPMKPPDRLRFGTAGIPISTPNRGKSGTVGGVEHVRILGLDCMELEFVRGVNVKEEKTATIKAAAEANDVILTCHAPYYINLNSPEKEKIVASRKRIFDSARIASLCGARTVVFHAAYYMKLEKEHVYDLVKREIQKILDAMKDKGIDIVLRPEVTGKESQFGSLQELLRLSSELDGVLPCIDFAHQHARSIGKYNTYKEFCSVFEEVEKALGKTALRNMHMHMAGIEYGQKGEKHHLILKESDFNYRELMRAFGDFNIAGTLICESPNIEEDALLMQKTYAGF